MENSKKQGGGQEPGTGSGRPPKRQYDASLKRLCLYPEVVRDLIAVALPHLKDKVDFSTLQELPTEFVGPDRTERRSDCVWAVNLRDSDERKIILIECQASPDKAMAVRIMSYVSLMYENLLRRAQSGMPKDRLPEVFPIVLFCGPERWNVPEDVAEMIGPEEEAPAPGERPPHWPQLRYHLFDVHRHPVGDAPEENLILSFCALVQTDADPLAPEALKWKTMGPYVNGLRKRLQSIGRRDLTDEFSTCLKEFLMVQNWEALVDLSPAEQVDRIAAELGKPAPRWAEEFIAVGREESLDTARKRIFQEVSSRFDAETAGKLAERLESITDLDLLMEIHGQIRGGMAGSELLAWMDARA